MTETTVALLHPSLHKLAAIYRRRLRLLGLFIFFIFGGLMLYAMVAALTGPTLEPMLTLGVMGLLVVPTVALVAGVMWYADRRVGKKLEAAHQLLTNTVPQSVWLQPRDAAASNPQWVTLRLPSGDQVHAVFADKTSLKLLPADSALQLYGQQPFVSGITVVAMRPDGVALLGQIVNPTILQSRQRARKMVLAVTVLAVLLMVLLPRLIE